MKITLSQKEINEEHELCFLYLFARAYWNTALKKVQGKCSN